ncbi:MAG TPA: CaiB/BaiF CoA-transferase family protein [Myxococcota bacterium]|nr:CaiB/BaiF CoA-transferase family protein [Myxococcota bacterium]
MLLQGLRVVEMGFWVAAPAAAGLLADWGADVVKIEPPRGDPMRQFYRVLAGVELPSCPGFDLDNRGKRSVALDLADPAARAAARALVLGADVFITNYRLDALARLGFDYESLAAESPRLVYGHVTGYGQDGPDAGRAAYDIGAFWARAGIASILAPAGGEPAGSRAGFGDHITASHCVAGVLAALLARERTGKGQLVDACLLRSGIYTIGFDVTQQLAFGGVQSLGKREEAPSPTITSFKSGDGRWVWMLGVEAERHWPRLCRAFELDALVDDPRFANPGLRAANCRELIRILDEQFAKRPLADWIPRFDAVDLWWAPVNTPADVVQDRQAIAAGAFVDVPNGAGTTQKSVGSPVRFSGADVAPRGKVPGIGEHTAEVLAELRS